MSKIHRLHNDILEGIEAGFDEVLEPSDLINVLVEVDTDENSGNLDLKCYLAYPNFPITIVPINPLKICQTPLSVDLIQNSGSFKTGMLTLDQSRRILPLLIDDPMVLKFPMIGIWISGVRDMSNPMVWAACVKHVC